MIQQLRTLLETDIYPFHMPGHKRNPLFFPPDLPFWDITEIPGMDNLHKPQGMIRDLQRRLSNIYGADESFLLVNGSSSGIIAAVCASCCENETVHIARNVHQSVFHALALSGAFPLYQSPGYFADGLVGGVLPSGFNQANVAVITSPTYEGLLPDVNAIANEVHKNNGILIVDEAHGAHFPFHKSFPANALSQGADIVINSLHKTLPVLSQTAVLHVQGARVDRERLRFYIQTLQTTSPSYMMMGMVDYFLKTVTPDMFDSYVDNINTLRNALSLENEKAPIRLSGTERVGEQYVVAMDFGKLLFNLNTCLTEEALITQYKIQPEMFNENHFLAMTSVADTMEGLNRLLHVIEDLNWKMDKKEMVVEKFPPLPEVIMSPRDTMWCKKETVSRTEAVNRIAGEIIAPYPPGIPVLAPGERIGEALYGWLPEYVKVIV